MLVEGRTALSRRDCHQDGLDILRADIEYTAKVGAFVDAKRLDKICRTEGECLGLFYLLGATVWRDMPLSEYRLRVDEIRVFYDVTNDAVEILALVPKSEAAA